MKRTRSFGSCTHCEPVPTSRLSALGIALGVVLVAAISGSSWLLRPRAEARRGAPEASVLTMPTRGRDDLRQRTEELIGYSKTVVLSPEQERVRLEALAAIKAPCGDRNSLAVRCCPCNLGRSIVGLANHLIEREWAGAPRVREAVLDWIRQTNPSGYSGAACERKRCDQPFRKDGCGGMTDARLVF